MDDLRFWKLIILFVSLALISCEKEIEDTIDLNSFDEITEEDMYEFLVPAMEFDYFEVRYSGCGEIEFETIYESGTKCYGFSDTTKCIGQSDSLKSEEDGFHFDCLPSCCSYYVVSQINQTNQIYATTSDLKTFLGNIDSKSDALFLAFSHGYSYEYDSKDRAAIKEIENGFQIIAKKRVSDCSPYQVDKFLLEITTNGNINILEQNILYKDNGSCI